MESQNCQNYTNTPSTQITTKNSSVASVPSVPPKRLSNIRQDFGRDDKNKNVKQDYNSNTNYKSTEFNERDLDEKIESPISVRKLDFSNYSNSTNTSRKETPGSSMDFGSNDYNSIRGTIHLKSNFITNLNLFMQNFVNDLYSLFNKIDSLIYKRVTSILDKNKYFIRFFKEITTLYETFSINLLQANNTISLHLKDEEEGAFGQVNKTVDKVQELISNSFYDFSKNMQKKIISKGPLSNVKEFYTKMSNIAKESSNIISQITKKRDKLMQKFIFYEKIFENFKKNFNDTDKLLNIFQKNEFFLIEFEFCNSANKLFSKIEFFFTNYKKCIEGLKSLSTEFINSIKDSIDLYIMESKKMFIIEEIDNLLINLANQVNDLCDEEKDVLIQNTNYKSVNTQLKYFQSNLLKYTFISNENLYSDELFRVEKYKNYEELIDFLLTIVPHQFEILNSNLVQYSCEVDKISGLFKTHKKCILVITIQNTLLIFEEKLNKKNYEKLIIKNIKFKNIEENKKSPYRFEISELKLGVLYNTTFKILLETENLEILNKLESYLCIK